MGNTWAQLQGSAAGKPAGAEDSRNNGEVLCEAALGLVSWRGQFLRCRCHLVTLEGRAQSLSAALKVMLDKHISLPLCHPCALALDLPSLLPQGVHLSVQKVMKQQR